MLPNNNHNYLFENSQAKWTMSRKVAKQSTAEQMKYSDSTELDK